MGGAESKITSKVMNKLFNKNITNILNKSTNIQTNSVEANQSAKIVGLAGSTIICTSGTGIYQTQKGTVNFVSEVDDTTVSEIKNAMESDLDTKLEQFQSTSAEMGSTLGSYINQENETSIKNEITNIIESNVTTEKVNEILNQVQFNQDGSIEIAGYYEGPCTIDQTQTINFQAANIISNLAKAISDNETISSAITDVKQSQELELTGLATLVTSIGEAIADVATAAMGPLIIIAVAGLIFLMMGGKLAGSATGGAKSIGMLFIIVALGLGGYMAWAYTQKEWPFSEIPQDVKDEGCEDEFLEAKEVYDDYEDARTEDAKKNILLKDKAILDAYSKCMGIEESYIGYPTLKEAYRHKRI